VAKGPNLSMQKKMMIVLAFVFLAGFIILIGRLVKLQVINGRFYAQLAAKQQLSVTAVPANRGTIFDRNLKPLAQSATVWDVCVYPSYIKEGSAAKDEAMRQNIAGELSKILSMDKQTIYNKLIKKSSYEVIAKKIEKPTADLVRQYINTQKNGGIIGLSEDSKRYYLFGNFASQLLGFTGADNQGLSGIEAQYDSTLKGVPGRIVTAKNAQGTDMKYDYEAQIPAQNGTNLVLTIDEVVQSTLENTLTQALKDNNVTSKVTGIAMNVKTGEILGMATVPGFDPNTPFEIYDPMLKATLTGKTGDDLKTATAAAQQNQWRNKAITDPYEPGSTFKIITASAGLEEGVVKESDTFFDSGSVLVSGTTFHCWKSGGHGKQTFLQGFENSCNMVFIEVGRRLGAVNFFKYFSNFGLTAKTGIDLPGEATSIYYKQADLRPVELASISFGQSNKITPIELITAVAAAANGGTLVTPHVVKEFTDQNGNVIKTVGTTVKRQVISAETSKEICRMLELEVSEGTGKNAYVAGYRVGGKTGTSQKLDSKDPTARIASFVGVAPCDDPQVAVLILMDDPHSTISNFGGVIAAPVVGSIMAQILPYLGVEPIYTPEEQQKLDIKTPSVVGKSLSEAQSSVKAALLVPSVVGTGQTVTGQVPAAGDQIPKGGKVILYTGNATIDSSVDVPILTGLTADQVNQKLASVGLNAKFIGAGLSDSAEKAYEQDHAPGTKVPRGTVIAVKFRNEQITVQ